MKTYASFILLLGLVAAGCSQKDDFPVPQALYDEYKAIMCAEKLGIERTPAYITRQLELNKGILEKAAPNNTYASATHQAEHLKRFADAMDTSNCERVKDVKINLAGGTVSNSQAPTGGATTAGAASVAASPHADLQGVWIINQTKTNAANAMDDPMVGPRVQLAYLGAPEGGLLVSGSRVQDGPNFCQLEASPEKDGMFMCLKADRSVYTRLVATSPDQLTLMAGDIKLIWDKKK